MLQKEWRRKIDQCLEVAFQLFSEREIDFLESVKERAKTRELSEKQAKWLLDLYKRACESPY